MIKTDNNTILVVAAHPDDELLGVGGTIRRLVNEGYKAHALILAEGLTSRGECRSDTDRSELDELRSDAKKAATVIGYESIDLCDLPDNRMDEADLLDIIKLISKYVDAYKPGIIFTHHHGDLNIDHQRTCEAVLTACRPVGGNTVRAIYAFETPSSTEWDYTHREPFNPVLYYDISDTIDAKIKGMACYRSESTQFPHPRSSEALRALAQYRGSNIGVSMAEAFEILRELR